MSSISSKFHQVCYREGGTRRFRWSLVLENFSTLAEAVRVAAEIEAGGRVALISPPGGFRHGLPETWLPGQSPTEFVWQRGWLVPA